MEYDLAVSLLGHMCKKLYDQQYIDSPTHPSLFSMDIGKNKISFYWECQPHSIFASKGLIIDLYNHIQLRGNRYIFTQTDKKGDLLAVVHGVIK